MSQSFTLAFNGILSDTVSNSRRTPFGGSIGWEANTGINIAQYQCGATPISIGNAQTGLVITSDQPVDVSCAINGTAIKFSAQTMLVLSGPVTCIALNVTNGYPTSTTNVCVVS